MIFDAVREKDIAAHEKYVREVIVPAVAARYGRTVSEILGHADGYAEDERSQEIAWERSVGIWMAWNMTRLDGSTMARILGGFPGRTYDAITRVEHVMHRFPAVGEELREFFRGVHTGTYGLLPAINELDQLTRRAA